MKRFFLLVAQFVLFFVIFAGGSFFPPLHVRQALAPGMDGPRVFVWDGVLLMLVVYGLILGSEAARRRLRSAGPWTTLALLLAGSAGYAVKLGFLTVTR